MNLNTIFKLLITVSLELLRSHDSLSYLTYPLTSLLVAWIIITFFIAVTILTCKTVKLDAIIIDLIFSSFNIKLYETKKPNKFRRLTIFFLILDHRKTES